MFKPEHQPTSFRALIEQIHRCNALSVIGMMIAEYRILFNDVVSQQLLMSELYALNDVDEIRLKCAQYLGLHQEVIELQSWIASRHQRQRASDPLGDIFGDIFSPKK